VKLGLFNLAYLFGCVGIEVAVPAVHVAKGNVNIGVKASRVSQSS
jgi:hypothetical protein